MEHDRKEGRAERESGRKGGMEHGRKEGRAERESRRKGDRGKDFQPFTSLPSLRL